MTTVHLALRGVLRICGVSVSQAPTPTMRGT